ncbi:MAG: response regulator, partial [Isosphaeraceae bacterium]
FGYDPTHSIVRARQEGLQTVLYKPFRSDRLMDSVEQALRQAAPVQGSHGGSASVNHSPADPNRPANDDGHVAEPRPTEAAPHES